MWDDMGKIDCDDMFQILQRYGINIDKVLSEGSKVEKKNAVDNPSLDIWHIVMFN